MTATVSEIRESLRTSLETILRNVLKDPDFALRFEMATGAHPNWDSIANVEILLSCEEYWNILFSSAEIDRMRTIDDIIDVVAGKRG